MWEYGVLSENKRKQRAEPVHFLEHLESRQATSAALAVANDLKSRLWATSHHPRGATRDHAYPITRGLP